MTRPKRTFDTEFGRFYNHPASQARVSSALAQVLSSVRTTDREQPNPSVTNIMKVLDEGFLPRYYSRLVADFAVEAHEQIDAMLIAGNAEQAVELLRTRPDLDHMNSAIGTEIHKAIEDYADGKKPVLTWPQSAKMFAQWVYFQKMTGIKLIRTEFTVWNYTHGYAGTGDFIAKLNGRYMIVDAKSGTRIYPKVAMQNAAIQHGESIIAVNGEEKPFQWIEDLGVLHIRPMSCKLYKLERTEEAFEAFLACKRLFDWIRFDKDGCIPAKPDIETLYRKTTASQVIRKAN